MTDGARTLVNLTAGTIAVVSAVGCRDDAADSLDLGGNEVAFADGVRARLLAIEPEPLVPGRTVRVQLALEHGSGRLALVPPRVLGRQLALGGTAPPPPPPLDPRVTEVAVAGQPEPIEVALSVPKRWHAGSAAVVLERTPPAVAGPRTEAGRAVLALVAVAAVPTRVVAVHVADSVTLDGRLDESVWDRASWTALVDSRDGEPQPELHTRVAFVWTDDALLMGIDARDDDVWSTFTSRDAELWKQEAVELFVFGTEATSEQRGRRNYLELQVAPTGAMFDAAFARYRDGDASWDGAWEAAVSIDGTLDHPGDRDRGVRYELRVPWSEICEHTDIPCTPKAGLELRINVFRLDRGRGRRGRAVTGLALSPPRVADFHAPEHAAVLVLADSAARSR